jgi:rod shape-determining protein MreB
MIRPLSALFGLFSRDLGIDLGTANTLVYVRGKGIVISEPSVVAVDKKTRRVLAVGVEAKAMVGKTPDTIVAVRPLKDGVIADFDTVEIMLHYFIRKVHAQQLLTPHPRVVIGIPSGVTEVEKRAAKDAALSAGAREAYTIEEPMAAAIGAGLPINEPVGSMIVDIGGGTTEVAVTSLGGIVVNRSIRVAGDEIDEAIVQWARRDHNLIIGERTAENAKIAAGSAYPLEEERRVVLRGRDVLTGLPKAVEVSSVEIREAIAGPVNQIIEAVRSCVEETPPELLADIMERGIVLAGGGALLMGLDKRLQAELRIPVYLADDPLTCVARGTGRVAEALHLYQRALQGTQQRRVPAPSSSTT